MPLITTGTPPNLCPRLQASILAQQALNHMHEAERNTQRMSCRCTAKAHATREGTNAYRNTHG